MMMIVKRKMNVTDLFNREKTNNIYVYYILCVKVLSVKVLSVKVCIKKFYSKTNNLYLCHDNYSHID